MQAFYFKKFTHLKHLQLYSPQKRRAAELHSIAAYPANTLQLEELLSIPFCKATAYSILVTYGRHVLVL